MKKPAAKPPAKVAKKTVVAKRPAAKPASPARPIAKPSAKPSAKPVAKPVAKPIAKPKAVVKTAAAPTKAKPPAKPARAPAPARKPAAKTPLVALKSPTKPPSAPAAVKTPAKPTVATKPPPAVVSAPLPVAPPKPARATTKADINRALVAAAALPSPAPIAPPSNRFTDRFAPARAPIKSQSETVEVVKPPVKIDPKLANAWKTKAGRELRVEELLAMPEAEYMNDKQLDFFRARLQKLKDDLLSNAGQTTEHLREDTTIVPDPADRATIEEEHALELRTRDRERKLLKKISQSLVSVESGNYGFCDETGEPIGLARLIARPTATLSLEAQQRREMKQKMFGD